MTKLRANHPAGCEALWAPRLKARTRARSSAGVFVVGARGLFLGLPPGLFSVPFVVEAVGRDLPGFGVVSVHVGPDLPTISSERLAILVLEGQLSDEVAAVQPRFAVGVDL